MEIKLDLDTRNSKVLLHNSWWPTNLIRSGHFYAILEHVMVWVTSVLKYYTSLLCFSSVPQQCYQGKVESFVVMVSSMLVDTRFASVTFCKSLHPSAAVVPHKTRAKKPFPPPGTASEDKCCWHLRGSDATKTENYPSDKLLRPLGCIKMERQSLMQPWSCTSPGWRQNWDRKPEYCDNFYIDPTVCLPKAQQQKCSYMPYPESFCFSERAVIFRDKGQGKHCTLVNCLCTQLFFSS